MEGSTIRTLEDIKKEKERIKRRNSLTGDKLKSNLNEAKNEGQDFALKKVLLPIGIAIITGYGIRKLLQKGEGSGKERKGAIRSEFKSGHETPSSTTDAKSGFDWLGTLVKFVPFAISVGQKLYEDGHFSFLFGESEDETVWEGEEDTSLEK